MWRAFNHLHVIVFTIHNHSLCYSYSINFFLSGTECSMIDFFSVCEYELNFCNGHCYSIAKFKMALRESSVKEL